MTVVTGKRKEYELLFKLKAALGSNYTSSFSSAIKTTKTLQDELSRINTLSRKIDGFKKQTTTLENNRKKLADLTAEHDLLQKEMRETETPSESLRKKLEKNQKQVETLTNRIEDQKSKLSELGQELTTSGIDTNNLGKANSELAESYGEIKRSQEEVIRTQQEYERLNEAQAENSAAISKTKGDLLKTVGIAGALGTALYLGPVTAAAEFEEQMSKVEAISGATKEEIARLSAKAKEMGIKTKFTAVESGKALEYMAMAGWKTGDMLDGIEGIMSLSAASGEDLAQTADIVTDALTAFKLKASDSAHFADVLAAASASSNTNVSMLGESFKYAAPLAGAYGFAVEDTALMLGLMANAGIKASQGGTAMRKMLAALTTDLEITQKDGSKFIVATTNADGSMRSLKEIVDDMRIAFNGMSKAEIDAAQEGLSETAKNLAIDLANENGELKTQAELYAEVQDAVEGLTASGKVSEANLIAGKTSMAGLLSIVNASEEDYANLADAIYNADGAAKKMQGTMLDNLSGKTTLAKSAIEGMQIAVGEALLPTLTEAMVKATELISNFAKWAQENPETIRSILKLAAGFFAVKAGGQAAKLGFLSIKGGVLNVQKLVKLFTGDISAMGVDGIKSLSGMGKAVGALKGAFSLLSGPVGIAIAAVAAITAGVYLFIKAQEDARQDTLNFSDNLKTAAKRFDDVNSKAAGTKELVDEYRELEAKTKNVATSADEAAAAKERMREVEDLLIEQNPDILSRYDQENGKISENLDLIERKLGRELELARIQYEQAQYEAERKMPNALAEIANLNEKTASLREQYDASKKVRDGMQELYHELEVFYAKKPSDDEISKKLDEIRGKAEKLGEVIGENWDFSSSGMVDIGSMWMEYDKKASSLADQYGTASEELDTVTQSVKDYYDTSVKLIELDLGGNFEAMAKKLSSAKSELAELEKGGQGSSGQASGLRKEISELQPKVETAAAEIRDLGLAVESVPQVKTVDVKDSVKEIDGFLAKLNQIPISKSVELIVRQNGGDSQTTSTAKTTLHKSRIPGYASGGIIMRPTLATFAEKSPEAAIPLDGSANARSLWLRTGKLLGMTPRFQPAFAGVGTPGVSAPSLMVAEPRESRVDLRPQYAVYVNGNQPGDLEEKLRAHDEELLRRVKEETKRDQDDERRRRYD